jgi:hypothetical protein
MIREQWLVSIGASTGTAQRLLWLVPTLLQRAMPQRINGFNFVAHEQARRARHA